MVDISFNIITIILIVIFLYPIVKAFIHVQGADALEEDIWDIEKNMAFIFVFFISLIVTKNIVILRNFGPLSKYIPFGVTNFLDEWPKLSYLIVLPISLYIIYYIVLAMLKGINYFTLKPLVSCLNKFFKSRGKIMKRILSSIFNIPKAACYIILLSFMLNWASLLNLNDKFNNYLQESTVYVNVVDYIINPITKSSFAQNIPNIINDSFKVVEVKDSDKHNILNKSNVVVYYNGVTLEEGIKSNDNIKNTTLDITSGIKNDKDKAKVIYNWVGSKIEYDYEKAKLIMRGDYSIPSGAIATFNSKKGICFDYSALYVAMAREAGLKVRLVTGEGFNGTTWVSHAWNQIYIKEENKWINVDTTFYNGGNYFNSKKFNLDHRDVNIAGEW